MKKEIVELRKLMEDEGMDAYFVPSGDFHNSEYVNAFFRTRAFLSGFTGSAGELLVTADGAWLWTDGRYFLQASRQLEGSGIELMKMGEEGVPTVAEFLLELDDSAKKDYVIGFDGRVVSSRFVRALTEKLSGSANKVIFNTGQDLGGKVWKDRPEIRPTKVWDLPVSSAGADTSDKIRAVRSEMKEAGAEYLLITDLMESAWLLNLRADDILYTPVFFSFILLTQESVYLYVMDGTLADGLPERLSFVEVKAYEDIYNDVAALPEGSTLWLDPATCNCALYKSVPERVRTHEALTPVALMKMIKNEAEIEGMKRAHVLDGVAVTKLIRWLKETSNTVPKTELSVAEKLKELRLSNEECFDLSFDTIAGYGPNGAIIHYSPTPESDAEVKPEGFLLVDSGGQYMAGTTDITRTIAVGPLTEEMIDDYTYVLKAHLKMAMFRLAPDMDSVEIDKAARAEMNPAGLDFNHGISHGVGHVLSVHEGPNGIKKGVSSYPIKAGMIMSNEPGVYIEDKFGIRIENMVVFKDDKDGFIVNEPLTCVPYEREAIKKELLTDEQLKYVNDYHKWVRETLTPLLDKETAEWLAAETSEL
ncbi:MAG: aminopeptidase P family protein [Mogibacterium sp.]|nr:aminopeptidase P family protein [Mogibacterium sp.]MBQ6500568.1 aminopeptidase P family protein [Mogibacterium sp.]